jgi:hypothetical protein
MTPPTRFVVQVKGQRLSWRVLAFNDHEMAMQAFLKEEGRPVTSHHYCTIKRCEGSLIVMTVNVKLDQHGEDAQLLLRSAACVATASGFADGSEEWILRRPCCEDAPPQKVNLDIAPSIVAAP